MAAGEPTLRGEPVDEEELLNHFQSEHEDDDGDAIHETISVAIEHGSIFIQCSLCGASWSVHEVVTETGAEENSYEEIDAGDGWCIEAATRKKPDA